jgi:hypothetical protein
MANELITPQDGESLDPALQAVADWATRFQDTMTSDGGGCFEADIERFALEATPADMVKATVALVFSCCAMYQLNGQPSAEFLAHQQHAGAPASPGIYRMLFELGPSAVGVLMVDARLRWIDLADLYEMPWHHLERVGYVGFWVTRLDGADFDAEEVALLDKTITADLRYDFAEDEVCFYLDPDTWPGSVYCSVYDHSGGNES